MPVQDLFYSQLIDEYTSNPRRIKRAWLEARLQIALEQPENDFVLISGEPGTGKSTFMLEMAASHPNWPRYLIRKDQMTPFGEPSPRSVLLQTGFQLAARYPDLFHTDRLRVAIKQRVGKSGANSEIVGVEVDRILASPFYQAIFDLEQQIEIAQGKVTGLKVGEWIADPNMIPLADLQNMAWFDPLLALAQELPSERIVILIDALDELRFRNDRGELLNFLSSLPELPANLKFALTSRIDDVLLGQLRARQAGRLFEIILREDDPDLQQDVREYATTLANEPMVKQVLDRGPGVKAFIDMAAAKANSNLGYLDAIGRAIDQALLNNQPQLLEQILDMQALPDTLKELYGAFLGWLRSAVEAERVEVEDAQTGEISLLRAWTAVYYKVLGLLAVAMSSLNTDQMRGYGNILPETPVIRDALQRMSQFLDRQDDRSGDRFRLYHTTLAEYLTDKNLHTLDQTQDFFIDASAWHKRIAEVAWRTGAPDWKIVDEYILGALAMHLLNAGDHERLKQLSAPTWMAARFQAAGHTYAGFLDDLRTIRKALASRQLPEDIPDLILGSLLTTGLVGISNELPPALILRLVTTGAWSQERALDTVARFTDMPQAERAYSLLLDQASLDATLAESARQNLQTVQTRMQAQNVSGTGTSHEFDYSALPDKNQMAVLKAVRDVLQAKNAQRKAVDLVSDDYPMPDWDKLYKTMDAAFAKGAQASPKTQDLRELWIYLGVGLAFTLPQPRREWYRLLATALNWLAQVDVVKESLLSSELLEVALQLAEEMPVEQKILALTGLAQLAPDQMVADVFKIAMSQIGVQGFGVVLETLAGRLSAEQAEQAAAVLRQTALDATEQAEILLVLLTNLPKEHNQLVLSATLEKIALIPEVNPHKTTSPQARYRKRIAPYLEGEAYQNNLESALNSIRKIPTRPNHTLMLKALEFAEWLPLMPAEQASELAQSALNLVDVDEPIFLQYILPAVYPFLPVDFNHFGSLRVAKNTEADFAELIDWTQSKKMAPPADLVWRVLLSNVAELHHILPPGRVLLLLAVFIPAGHLEQAVQIALDHADDLESGETILILLPRLDMVQIRKVVDLGWNSLPVSMRWKILAAASSRLDEQTAERLKQQAKSELESIQGIQSQAELLGGLAQARPDWIVSWSEASQEMCWKLLQPLDPEPRADYLRRAAALLPAFVVFSQEERLEAISQALLKGLDWQWL